MVGHGRHHVLSAQEGGGVLQTGGGGGGHRPGGLHYGCGLQVGRRGLGLHSLPGGVAALQGTAGGGGQRDSLVLK